MIVYQGTQGSFSALAARAVFGSGCVLTGKETFLSLFDALESDEAEIAVVPIENSLIGSIWENSDLMQQFDIQIVGEKVLKIEHCLLGIAEPCMSMEERIRHLRRVYSHPKALDQCRAFFAAHPWIEPVVHYDTAGAAQMLAQKGTLSEGAIASSETAELYSLCSLKREMADNPHNYTRFLFVKRRGQDQMVGDKCSLIFTLKHTPGALSAVLNVFAENGVNLTKVESRPIVGRPFEYAFFIDLEFDRDQDQVLEKTKELTQSCKMLGIYNKDTLCCLDGSPSSA